jgi:hypothetical protein
MKHNPTKLQRVDLTVMFGNVTDEVRLLMHLVSCGLCPFCYCHVTSSPTTDAIRRGLVGDKLREAIAQARHRDVEDGIDPDNGHAVGCRLVAWIAQMGQTLTLTPSKSDG